MDNNNFERFFNEQFSKDIPKQSWNTPSESVWENIENQLDKPKRRQWVLPLFLLGTALVIGAMAILLINNYKKSQLIEHLSGELLVCKSLSTEEVHNINENKAAVAVINNNYQTNESSSEIKENKINIDRFQATVSSVKRLGNNNSVLVSSPIYGGSLPNISRDEPATLISEEIVYNHNHIPNQREIFDIELLPTKNNGPVHKKEGYKYKLLHTINTNEIEHLNNLPSSLELGMTSGFISWQSRKKGQLSNPLNEILKHEDISNSSFVGFGLNYNWGNKWAFNLGLNYFSRQLVTQYSVNLPYDTKTEISNGIDIENSFDHSLPTGWGNVNTTLILSRSMTSQLPNNVSVPIDMSVYHQMRSLEAPLKIQFFPWGPKKGWFLNTGLSTEWIMSTGKTKMESWSSHNIIKEKNTESTFDNKQINHWLVSSSFGAGWKKSITKNINFNIIADYTYGLNSLINTSTYTYSLNRLSVGASLFYNFNSGQ